MSGDRAASLVPCATCLGHGLIERMATPDEVDAGCELGIAYDPCPDCASDDPSIVDLMTEAFADAPFGFNEPRYPHVKALAADLWDTVGNERERERAIEARQVLDDARIADRVRSIVSSVGKLDPEWSPAEAYEHAQERLMLYILGHSGDR